MRYFITGATGFIGGHVARQLLAAGHEVVALVRTPAKAQALAEAGAELAPGDITDRASVAAAMAGVDGVFHIAAWYEVGVADTSRAYAINVGGTRTVLEVMRDLGIPKGVYTSTLAVHSDTHGALVDESYRYDGPHLSEYDRTKWAAHYEVALPMIAAGLPLVVVQPGVVYGPGDHSTIRQTLIDYLRGRLPMAPKGTAFCWAHVEDVARGHILAMEKGRPGECYHLAGPAMTLVEVLAVAERITGIKAPRIAAPPALLRGMAALMAVVERVLPVPATFRSETLRVSAGTTYIASADKARRELGFEARSVEDGLRETLEHEMALLGLSPRR
ncbi:MAG: SDR family NAD(P)-dependent oxidoreductase [Myxococcales bacterium]|nr:SDR family NAD(P)-dependent oxidoreductase [Myxococcales bacterium]